MEKKVKIPIQAPLPFQGQKRHHAREFSRIIKELQPAIVVDLFGGSGFLSHLAKRASPQSRVIYNDFDNYSRRLAHVPQTNELLRYCRELLKDCQREAKITGDLRETILAKFAQANEKGFVDWITISSSLHFSMRYAIDYEGFANDTLYNKVRKNDYVADGYLDGLEVVKADYRELCKLYRAEPGALFLFDPPYLSTDVKTYSSAGYWTMKDYLDVITCLKGLNYIYFTSDKSKIVELCEWINDNLANVSSVFKGASVTTVRSSTTGLTSYTDIMLYKLNCK